MKLERHHFALTRFVWDTYMHKSYLACIDKVILTVNDLGA